jgi:hypothetical protein
LTERYEIDTHDFEVINIVITYGSKYAIAIVKDSNTTDTDHFEILGYSLNSFQQKWCKPIDGTYIKMKNIELDKDIPMELPINQSKRRVQQKPVIQAKISSSAKNVLTAKGSRCPKPLLGLSRNYDLIPRIAKGKCRSKSNHNFEITLKGVWDILNLLLLARS